MAVLTFPLSMAQFFDLLPATSVQFDPTENVELSETTGGEVIPADIGTTLWTGQIDMDLLTRWEAAEIGPVLNLLKRGGEASFLVSDSRRLWPRLDPRGLALGASMPSIQAVAPNMRELSLSGLPAGYVLSRADLIGWTYGASPTRHALHELVGSVTAGPAGTTALVEVNPPIRTGVAVGTPVQLRAPTCKARLIPGSGSIGTSKHTISTGATLRWTQTLR